MIRNEAHAKAMVSAPAWGPAKGFGESTKGIL